MPTIASYSDRNQAQEAFNLLELNGIPPYLKSNGGIGNLEVLDLIVIFPEQVEDAIELLRNPDHEVRTCVDMTKFYEAENSGDGLKTISRYMTYAAIFFASVVALLIGLALGGVL